MYQEATKTMVNEACKQAQAKINAFTELLGAAGANKMDAGRDHLWNNPIAVDCHCVKCGKSLIGSPALVPDWETHFEIIQDVDTFFRNYFNEITARRTCAFCGFRHPKAEV